MVFTIYDYVIFKLGIGRYSEESIRKDDGNLFTEEVLSNLDTGDFIFFHTQSSFLSWGICYFTNSVWSHMAQVSEGKNVLDVTTKGCIEHSLSDYVNGQTYYAAFRPKGVSSEEIKRILQEMRAEYLGTRYGWGKAVGILLSIVMARNRNYRLRISVDILLLMFLLYFLFGLKLFLVIILFYSLFVLKNIIVHHKMKVKF
jgi:hypothetical protein